MNGKGLIEAVAYFRTSSATNVGDDKDSESRQREAVTRFAKRNGYAIVDTFYDEAVSGSDPITERPGFTAMLERIVGRRAGDPRRNSFEVCAFGAHPGGRVRPPAGPGRHADRRRQPGVVPQPGADDGGAAADAGRVC